MKIFSRFSPTILIEPKQMEEEESMKTVSGLLKLATMYETHLMSVSFKYLHFTHAQYHHHASSSEHVPMTHSLTN